MRFASAYPGTPSTEILEALSGYDDVYTEWAPNEKVAVEAATGASMAGARALACMKHVGLNVAADPFFSASHVGVTGGFVIVSADDPDMHSSQDEQDNRNYAKFAKMPMVEASDADEARRFLKAAYDISERFDAPVLFRTTTRTSHSQGVVRLGEREAHDEPLLVLDRDPSKHIMMPHNARPRHAFIEQRLLDLAEFAETTDLNQVEMGDTRVGIISSGAAYGYAREAFPAGQLPQAGHDLPAAGRAHRRLPRQGREAVRRRGARPVPRGAHPPAGRADRRRQGPAAAHRRAEPRPRGAQRSARPACPASTRACWCCPSRPPTTCRTARRLCAPAVRTAASSSRSASCAPSSAATSAATASRALAPFEAMHCSTCMGAGISMAHGMAKVMDPAADKKNRPVAIIGDSTFFHSGITSLLDVAYNKSNVVTIILDNRTTAMTGGQENPGMGKSLMGQAAPEVDIPALVRALGITRVREIDPLNVAQTQAVLKEEIEAEEPSVVIATSPCVLEYKIRREAYHVEADECTGCKVCLRAGCTALSLYKDDAGERKVADRPGGLQRLQRVLPALQVRGDQGASGQGWGGGPMSRPTFNILVSGVGGQGVVLASYVLSRCALAEGYDVKQSEVHGMAQRGGCVTSHLRFGDKVYNSLITPGTVDVLLAFESVEAMRYIHWLKPGGLLVYNMTRVNPSTVSSGRRGVPGRPRGAHRRGVAERACARRQRPGRRGRHREGGQRRDARRHGERAAVQAGHHGEHHPQVGAAQDDRREPQGVRARPQRRGRGRRLRGAR